MPAGFHEQPPGFTTLATLGGGGVAGARVAGEPAPQEQLLEPMPGVRQVPRRVLMCARQINGPPPRAARRRAPRLTPGRNRRASRSGSRRSVPTRSPGARGIFDGTATVHAIPAAASARSRPGKPHRRPAEAPAASKATPPSLRCAATRAARRISHRPPRDRHRDFTPVYSCALVDSWSQGRLLRL